MFESNYSWDTVIQLTRQDYERLYHEEIVPEIDLAKRQIPYYLSIGLKFPGKLPLLKSCFRLKDGESNARFFVSAYASRLRKKDDGQDECDIQLTTLAKFKLGKSTTCIAFTGDPDALYWEHFFDRFLEREKITDKPQPEKLYLDVLSDSSMWKTALASYESDKYDLAYVRPWGDGLALGSIYEEGELRGTYISRSLMRGEQSNLCKALIFLGDMRRLYNYRLEDNMDKTMSLYRSSPNHAKQIVLYFKYYWQVQRISAFAEHRLYDFDQEVERDADSFFRTHGLPIRYSRDCKIPVRQPWFFERGNW